MCIWHSVWAIEAVGAALYELTFDIFTDVNDAALAKQLHKLLPL